MAELKPCPFCGAKGILERHRNFKGKSVYQVCCPSTYVQVKTIWFYTEKEAVEAWNRRTNDEQIH